MRSRSQQFWFMKLRRYGRFTFAENTISTFSKAARAKLPGSGSLFCFPSISKFGSFRNPFTTVTKLYRFHFRWGFILLIHMKVISKSYGSSTSS